MELSTFFAPFFALTIESFAEEGDILPKAT
jgi:hypothetical protein